MPRPFLVATFRAPGLVFGRFSQAGGCSHADLRAERIDADGLHGRFAAHGVGAEHTRRLQVALDRRYGAVTHFQYHAHTATATGRVHMPIQRLREVIAGDLLSTAGHFGTPWLRFEHGLTTLRAPLLADIDPRMARRRVEDILRRHDPGATATVGPLTGRAAVIWQAMLANEAGPPPHLAPDAPL